MTRTAFQTSDHRIPPTPSSPPTNRLGPYSQDSASPVAPRGTPASEACQARRLRPEALSAWPKPVLRSEGLRSWEPRRVPEQGAIGAVLPSGEGGIRTPDAGITDVTVFETAAFNHSATSPPVSVSTPPHPSTTPHNTPQEHLHKIKRVYYSYTFCLVWTWRRAFAGTRVRPETREKPILKRSQGESPGRSLHVGITAPASYITWKFKVIRKCGWVRAGYDVARLRRMQRGIYFGAAGVGLAGGFGRGLG